MKRIHIIIMALSFICCFMAIPSYGQAYKVTYGGSLAGVAESERNDALVEIAREAVLKYAPEYYREYRKPDVSGRALSTIPPTTTIAFDCVTFFYNTEKEKINKDFTAAVIIDPATGKATDILLGNGMLLSDLGDGSGAPVPIESVPFWSPEYNPDDYSRTENLKNELLWGRSKDEKTRLRLIWEQQFVADSLKKEISKVHESRKLLRTKGTPEYELSAEEKKAATDRLTDEYYRLSEESAKSWQKYDKTLSEISSYKDR